jgi:hypothetical protein
MSRVHDGGDELPRTSVFPDPATVAGHRRDQTSMAANTHAKRLFDPTNERISSN